MRKGVPAAGRDGNPPAYAQKVWSTEGKQDGLHWPTPRGEPQSPLGDLVASASTKGYFEVRIPIPTTATSTRSSPPQGERAGGARSYVDKKGLMTGGFAAVAWPAKYGNSGVMTFVVDQQGIVFQKDLGPETERGRGHRGLRSRRVLDPNRRLAGVRLRAARSRDATSPHPLGPPRSFTAASRRPTDGMK
jgi:hypothetical protein